MRYLYLKDFHEGAGKLEDCLKEFSSYFVCKALLYKVTIFSHFKSVISPWKSCSIVSF